MEETEEDLGSEVPGAPNASSWPPSDFMEKLQSVSLVSQEEILKNRESRSKHEVEGLASEEASQIFWATGKLSEVIPNGFYSVIPEKRLKDLFDTIPSLNELYALDLEDVRADVILVDAEKDKKLSMLKQLIVTLVKGLNSNPTAMIKKIVALVCDFYKHPNSEPTPPKSLPEKISHASDNQGIQMLGQIRQGSSRSRAILFKVLADTVGLDSTLMVGLPREQGLEQTDSYKHISVLVRMNSVELLVDLMRFPGQMVPCLTKAIFMLHTPAMGESYFAENDCCDSPLEPNSPLCTFSERVDSEGSSHSEPNITNTFWRRSRKKVPAEQRTASSSPEHPLFRVHRQSTLGGDKHLLRAYTSDVAASRSVGASTSATCRRRRRCVSITPEIGDDIVRLRHCTGGVVILPFTAYKHHDCMRPLKIVLPIQFVSSNERSNAIRSSIVAWTRDFLIGGDF